MRPAPQSRPVAWTTIVAAAFGGVLAATPPPAPRAPVSAQGGCEPSGWRVLLREDFESAALNSSVWSPISENDCRSSLQDVLPRHDPDASDHALCLRADTTGADPLAVTRLGVVSVHPFDTREPLEITLDIDWNDQEDGRHLTAAAYLAPRAAATSAESLPAWIKVEYVGVPPGRNARAVVARKADGRFALLETEGWPERLRTGRRIARQRLKIVLDSGALSILENGLPLYASQEPVARFPRVFLHLEMSSHGSYPSRQVFFDDITVRARCQ